MATSSHSKTSSGTKAAQPKASARGAKKGHLKRLRKVRRRF